MEQTEGEVLSYPARTNAHMKVAFGRRGLGNRCKDIYLVVARSNETNEVLFTKCGKMVYLRPHRPSQHVLQLLCYKEYDMIQH